MRPDDDQQHQGERHLRGHQHLRARWRARLSFWPRPLSQRHRQRTPRGAECAVQSATAAAAVSAAVNATAAVEANLLEPRQTGRTEPHQHAHRAPRQHRPTDAPGSREERALGEEVSRDAASVAPSAGARRFACRALPSARGTGSRRSRTPPAGRAPPTRAESTTCFDPADQAVLHRQRRRDDAALIRRHARQRRDQIGDLVACVGDRHPVPKTSDAGRKQKRGRCARRLCRLPHFDLRLRGTRTTEASPRQSQPRCRSARRGGQRRRDRRHSGASRIHARGQPRPVRRARLPRL